MSYYLLCLDGPSNGMWQTADAAKAAGYRLDSWPSGEEVWVYSPEDAESDHEAYPVHA